MSDEIIKAVDREKIEQLSVFRPTITAAIRQEKQTRELAVDVITSQLLPKINSLSFRVNLATSLFYGDEPEKNVLNIVIPEEELLRKVNLSPSLAIRKIAGEIASLLSLLSEIRFNAFFSEKNIMRDTNDNYIASIHISLRH